MTQCHCGQFLNSCQTCQDRKNSDELKIGAEYKRNERARLKMEKQLTDKEKLEAAFEIKCSGILYEPEGCTQKLGTYKNGCGMCGKGNHQKCLNDQPLQESHAIISKTKNKTNKKL